MSKYTASNRRYYLANREKIRAASRARYYSIPRTRRTNTGAMKAAVAAYWKLFEVKWGDLKMIAMTHGVTQSSLARKLKQLKIPTYHKKSYA